MRRPWVSVPPSHRLRARASSFPLDLCNLQRLREANQSITLAIKALWRVQENRAVQKSRKKLLEQEDAFLKKKTRQDQGGR